MTVNDGEGLIFLCLVLLLRVKCDARAREQYMTKKAECHFFLVFGALNNDSMRSMFVSKLIQIRKIQEQREIERTKAIQYILEGKELIEE